MHGRFLQFLRFQPMMKHLKSALITGGSSGIGLALGKALASRGANVCLLARDPARLQTAQKIVSEFKIKADQQVQTISCDIRDFENLSNELDSFTKKLSFPDLVINSAGGARS